MLREVVERRDRHDRGDAGRDRHRDGEDVVDEQRRACDERRVLAEVLAADDVAAAAARVGEDRLAVRRDDDREQDRDRDADRDERAEAEREARPADRDDEEDLLGRVRGRRDRVGREHRERDGLRDPLVFHLGRGQRSPDQDPLDECHAVGSSEPHERPGRQLAIPPAGPRRSASSMPSAHPPSRSSAWRRPVACVGPRSEGVSRACRRRRMRPGGQRARASASSELATPSRSIDKDADAFRKRLPEDFSGQKIVGLRLRPRRPRSRPASSGRARSPR